MIEPCCGGFHKVLSLVITKYHRVEGRAADRIPADHEFLSELANISLRCGRASGSVMTADVGDRSFEAVVLECLSVIQYT
jgi:hypothetical protein